jgi:hypothetical protein
MMNNKDYDKDFLCKFCECLEKCLVSDEPQIDYEIEVIKRNRYSEDNIRKNRNGIVRFFNINIARHGAYRRALRIYTKVLKDLKLDSYPGAKDLSRDPAIAKIPENINIKVSKKESSGNIRGEYTKTILRKIFAIGVARGLIPFVVRNKDGTLILINDVIKFAETLARGIDRRVTNLCNDRSSCLRRIIEYAEELGVEVDIESIIERAVAVSSLDRELIEYIVTEAINKDISESNLLSLFSR